MFPNQMMSLELNASFQAFNLKSQKHLTKCMSAKFQCFIIAISYWEFKDWKANNVDPDEVAHDEPPHQDLYCLQAQQVFVVLTISSFLH